MIKVFTAIFSLFNTFLLVVAALASLSLKSTNVEEAISAYQYYLRAIWLFVPLATLILLILANVMSIRSKTFWPIWLAFAYWSLALFIDRWLEDQYISFRIHRLNDIYDAPIPLDILMFLVFAIPALIFVVANHLVVAFIGRSNEKDLP